MRANADDFLIAGERKLPTRAGERARRKQEVAFLRGPVPMEWLRHAITEGAAAIAAGLALWHYAGMRNSFTFKISITALAAAIGRNRRTLERGIQSLESAGLVEVVRTAGNAHTFTINEKANRQRGNE